MLVSLCHAECSLRSNMFPENQKKEKEQLTSQGHAEESCKSCCHAQQGAVAQPLPLILQDVPAVTYCLWVMRAQHCLADWLRTRQQPSCAMGVYSQVWGCSASLP